MTTPESKPETKAKVTEIIDGKTFKAESKKTYILESVNPPEKGELGYENAKKYLAELIEGKEVTIEETEESKVRITTKEKTKENEVITLDINALMQKQDKRRYK